MSEWKDSDPNGLSGGERDPEPEADDAPGILSQILQKLAEGTASEEYLTARLDAVREEFEAPLFWQQLDETSRLCMKHNLENFIRPTLRSNYPLLALHAYALLNDYRHDLKSNFQFLPADTGTTPIVKNHLTGVFVATTANPGKNQSVWQPSVARQVVRAAQPPDPG